MPPAIFGAGTAVYAERADGKILLLLRTSGGSHGGEWFLPGGAVDEGEYPEAGAVRELAEESGLVPTSPLTLIGLYRLPGYAIPALMVSYACTVGDAEIVLAPDEHTESRWVEPEEMRAEVDVRVAADPSGFLADIRADVDRYIAWRARR